MLNKETREKKLSMIQKSQKRIGYVDLYRGIGIILMIMAHIGFGSLFDYYIHAFHMPMFFFVSGFFYKSDSPDKFFKQKIKTLIIPYVFYTFIIYIGWKVICGNPDDSLIIIFLYMNSTPFVAAALWFLTALFIANVIYWLIQTLFNSDIYISIVAFLIALCGNIIQYFFAKPSIFAFDAGLVGVGIMHLGFLCRNRRTRVIEKIMNLNWNEIIIAFVLLSALIFINSKVNMREGKYGIIPLFWINSAGMCIILWNTARKLIETWNKNNLKNRAIDYLYSVIMNIGRRSLVFLCLNQVMIVVAFRYFPIEVSSNSVTILIHNIVMLFLVLVALYLIAILREIVLKKISNIINLL